jgi:hypothetical protein
MSTNEQVFWLWSYPLVPPYRPGQGQWLFRDLRRPLQRRYRSGFAPDSLFSSDRGQRHSLMIFQAPPPLRFGAALAVILYGS